MTENLNESWESSITSWLVDQRRAGLAATSLRTRREHLTHHARTIGLPVGEVTEDVLLGWWGEHVEPLAQETRRGKRTSLRAFYAWAADEGLVEASPAVALPRVKAGSARPRPTPDAAFDEALLRATGRERLMLRLAEEAGLRRGEVAVVRPDVDLVEDLDGWSLLVHGKGGKERTVPLTGELAGELLALPPGYAFPGQVNGHLSAAYVGKLVSRLLPRGRAMHGLRHRYATKTHDVVGDIRVVQELLGHASVATTQVYTLVRDAKKRAAVEGAAGARLAA